MDVDILWGLEDSMNPDPQWSAWALTSTKSGDDEADKNRRALVRKNRPREDLPERKQRLLAIALEPTESDEIPGLISDSEEEYSDDYETEDDEFSEDDGIGEDEQNYWDQLVRNYKEEERKRELEKAKEKEKSPEGRSNPFKTLFRSLKGSSTLFLYLLFTCSRMG
jgi:hypothetical protein